MASEAALFQQVAHLSDRQLQQEYLSNPDRAASLVQGISHLEDEALALRLVKLALAVKPRLGAQLAGAVPPELQGQAIQLIAELDAPLAFKYQLLGLTGSVHAIAHLRAAIEPTAETPRLKTSPEAAQAAILALKQIGSEAAITKVLPVLAHPNVEVQSWAAWALSQIGSETVVENLLAALQHESIAVQSWAVWALGQIGTEAAVAGLLQALQASDAAIRWKAAAALGKTQQPHVQDHLLQAMADPDPYVRERAVLALRHFANDAVTERLLWALHDPKPSVQLQAVVALGAIATETAIAGLLEALEHPESYVRGSIIDTLGEIGSEAVIPGLWQGLQDVNPQVREQAAEILATLETPAAIAALQQALQSDDGTVRELVAEVVQRQVTDSLKFGLEAQPSTQNQHPDLPPLIITSQAEVSRYIVNPALAGEVKYLISIGSPGAKPPRELHQVTQRLRLEFDDIDAPFDDPEYVLATAEHMQQVIQFAATIAERQGKWDGALLVHCQAGISRSAAIALAVCAFLLGAGREAEALAYVLAARPKARPNAWLVTLADAMLERDGKLVQAFQQTKPNMGLW